MLKIDYNIPVFEDEDISDLNEYSNQMANALKIQLDKFGNPLVYKGEVSTMEDLPTEAENGDIYSVVEENKNYIYNGVSWIEYSSTLNLSLLVAHKYHLNISTAVTKGGVITLPFYYKVGTGCLDVYYMSELLRLSSDDAGTDGHYREVGESGSISNQIKTTADWGIEVGRYFDFVVRGEYSND